MGSKTARRKAGQGIRLPVRALCEFLLRSGSIDSRFSGLDRGVRGTLAHRRLQRGGGPGYEAEVSLSVQMADGGFHYTLGGRADGVLERDGETYVDEIKTTVTPLAQLGEDDSPAHWAQGCCYAHILCVQRGLQRCGVQLRYYNLDADETRLFERRYTAEELAAFVQGLLAQYRRWAALQANWAQKRGQSLRALTFPFGNYRGGQRQMAIACYNTFKDGGRLFCCAPTGIGKTISALFPAMKALGEGHGERIFYLTAKTIARKAAQDALEQLEEACAESGAPLHFHSLVLTAKDKICFLEQRNCTPAACRWADGYYDRVNDAVYELLCGQNAYSREAVEDAARKHRLCPYELSLDLANWCDCVIGDYNYLFDPVVHLQRFFEGGGEHLFLVDEAHNLVERSREMYSARLCKSGFSGLKRQLPKAHRRLHTALAAVCGGFTALRRRCEAENTRVVRQNEKPDELEKPVERFIAAAEDFLKEHRGAEWESDLLALYFDALFYQRIAEEYDGRYTTLIERGGADVAARLFCLDPSQKLDGSLALGRAAVLFSATLQPLGYYRDTLGGAGAGAKLLALESPFPQERLGLFVAAEVSTLYARRAYSLPAVAGLLARMVEAKKGNYIAYFPSYSYMRQVLEVFWAQSPHIRTQVQQSGMDDGAREDFLAAFSGGDAQALLGFCVLGGIFAEGVDLPGNRLVGAAVVGVGLPQLGPEPDAIRDYYDAAGGRGFDYAYRFPGMNKVLQAAGRVIRTPTDRGVVLLIDSRFDTGEYRRLFPRHWAGWQPLNAQNAAAQLAAFWDAAAENGE